MTAELGITVGASAVKLRLVGTGGQGAPFDLVPLRYDFASVTLGSASAPASFRYSTSGPTASEVPGVRIEGPQAADFSIVQNTCTAPVAPASSCQLSVEFRPSGSGVRQGALIVSTGTATLMATLTGTGLALAEARLGAMPASLAFGAVVAGTVSAPQTVAITNVGGATSGVPKVNIVGDHSAEFAGVSSSCSGALAPGSSCSVSLAFTPATLGERRAVLEVSLPSQTLTIPLTGTGATKPQLLIVSPAPATELDLFEHMTGSCGTRALAQRTVTLSNPGGTPTGPLQFSFRGTDADDFVVEPGGTCQGPLGAGASCTVIVNACANDPGVHRATFVATAGAFTAVLNVYTYSY